MGFRGIGCQPLGENQNLLYEGTNIDSSPAISPSGVLVETGSHLDVKRFVNGTRARG